MSRFALSLLCLALSGCITINTQGKPSHVLSGADSLRQNDPLLIELDRGLVEREKQWDLYPSWQTQGHISWAGVAGMANGQADIAIGQADGQSLLAIRPRAGLGEEVPMVGVKITPPVKPDASLKSGTTTVRAPLDELQGIAGRTPVREAVGDPVIELLLQDPLNAKGYANIDADPVQRAIGKAQAEHFFSWVRGIRADSDDGVSYGRSGMPDLIISPSGWQVQYLQWQAKPSLAPQSILFEQGKTRILLTLDDWFVGKAQPANEVVDFSPGQGL